MQILQKKNRNHAIESLQFYYFLRKVHLSLRGTSEKTSNSLVLNFVTILEGLETWESHRIQPYLSALDDEIFWKSSNFYRATMQKFVDGELNALEFAEEFSDRLLADREKAKDLVEDFQKQADIEFNLDIAGFSEIILAFQLPLEVYQNEAEDLETGELSEKDLSFTPDSILEGVKLALEKINKYFKD